MKKALIFVLGTIIWSACQKQDTNIDLTSPVYYNIDSLLNVQLLVLSNSKVQLFKKKTSENSLEEITITMDSLEWKKAFSIFDILDINKPSLRDAYEITENIADSVSNLTIFQYQIKNAYSNQLLKHLTFYYLNDLQHLKKIVAESSTNNFIHQSHNTYKLTFNQLQNQTILKSYTISSTQKTLFKDTTKIILNFEIIY